MNEPIEEWLAFRKRVCPDVFVSADSVSASSSLPSLVFRSLAGHARPPLLFREEALYLVACLNLLASQLALVSGRLQTYSSSTLRIGLVCTPSFPFVTSTGKIEIVTFFWRAHRVVSLTIRDITDLSQSVSQWARLCLNLSSLSSFRLLCPLRHQSTSLTTNFALSVFSLSDSCPPFCTPVWPLDHHTPSLSFSFTLITDSLCIIPLLGTPHVTSLHFNGVHLPGHE